MTEELYNKLQPYKEIMRAMVINSACSNVPIAFRELVLGEMKGRGISLCHCNSGVLNATSRLYQEFLFYDKTHKSIEKQVSASGGEGGESGSQAAQRGLAQEKSRHRKNARNNKGE